MKRTINEQGIFRSIGILSSLDEKDFGDFLVMAKRTTFKNGETVMKDGEPGSSMYFFIAGEVEVHKVLSLKIGTREFSKTEKSMTRLKAETAPFFGDMALFGDERRSATITACSDCILFEVHEDDFHRFCETHPQAGVKILKAIAQVLSSRVRKGNEDVLKLTTALSVALARQER